MSEHLAVPCCPDVKDEPNCQRLRVTYRIPSLVEVEVKGDPIRVPVEIVYRVLFEICTDGLVLGDIVYNTTLFPGEEVRLFTMDRRSRFSFDSETKVAYRHEQTLEDSYYLSMMAKSFVDVESVAHGGGSSESSGSYEKNVSTNSPIAAVFTGADVDISGHHDAESSFDWLSEMSSHVRSSHERNVTATRSISSVSVGEVTRRTHAEGEAEDHFEASSRRFKNDNKCHAVTYFFHQILKKVRARLVVERVETRVIDPGADTRVRLRPQTGLGDVQAIPATYLATDEGRLEIEERGRQSVLAEQKFLASRAGSRPDVPPNPRYSASVRKAAVKSMKDRLERAHIIDKDGSVGPRIKRDIEITAEATLPTPGLLVRGCLDECSTCEPTREKEIELDLKRKELENALLQKQIDLLEKSQEYRCCPAGEEETEAPPSP